MAYSATLPPRLIAQGIGGQGPSLWSYDSVDASAVVDGSGYITDAGRLGIKAKDIVFSTDNDTSPWLTSSHAVVTVSATYPGAADLSDGVAITGASAGD